MVKLTRIGAVAAAAVLLVVGATAAFADQRQTSRQSVPLAVDSSAALQALKAQSIVVEKRAKRAAMQPLIDARKEYLKSQRSSRSNRAGVINACQNKKTGALAIKRKCSKREKKVSWNISGPAGAAGPAGPAGPAGSNATKTVFYEDVYGPYFASNGGYPGSGTSQYPCSAGGTAINGGYVPDQLGVFPVASLQDANFADVWFMILENNSGVGVNVYVSVYCAL